LASLVLSRALFGIATARADDRESTKPKTEVGVVPLAGGDSDIGFGGGELSSITRLRPGDEPYRWRIESGALITFKPPAGSGLRIPYEDYYVLLIVPDLVPNVLRLEVRPSYTKETTQLYYGIGNASHAPETGPDGQPAADYYQYGRLHPTLQVRARLALGHRLFVLVGDTFFYNRIDVHPGSQLDRDLASPSPLVRPFLGPVAPHFVNFFEYALLFDTRDDETNPSSGLYHQVKLRVSPGGSAKFPYRYAQVDAIARFYTTPVPRWLSFDLRVVGDGQVGPPPFYELARYEDTFALGGVNGVRGVPAQRYYGKVKLFGNVEARSELLHIALAGSECALGAALFFDAGRLWSDWHSREALDGAGVGLKYGTGFGLRVRQGKAFVVRGDLAWSPDARPIAGYFTAGHTS
jgi:hypothetical protein